MKSQLKLNRVGSCMCFVVAVALALSFSGCKTRPGVRDSDPLPQALPPAYTLPVTDAIIAVIRAEPVDASEPYYYLSKPISITRVAISSTSSLRDHGIDMFTSITNIDVPISVETHGVLQGNSFGNILNITFKTNLGDTVLSFRKQGEGNNERYELITTNGYITHNESTYSVRYDNIDVPPYLLIVATQRIELRNR